MIQLHEDLLMLFQSYFTFHTFRRMLKNVQCAVILFDPFFICTYDILIRSLRFEESISRNYWQNEIDQKHYSTKLTSICHIPQKLPLAWHILLSLFFKARKFQHRERMIHSSTRWNVDGAGPKTLFTLTIKDQLHWLMWSINIWPRKYFVCWCRIFDYNIHL